MEHLTHTLIRLYVAMTLPERRDERGDVPGWVMITVMTVGIVGIIWGVAQTELRAMLGAALKKLGPTG